MYFQVFFSEQYEITSESTYQMITTLIQKHPKRDIHNVYSEGYYLGI